MSKTNAQLVKENEELLEEMYERGVRVRPSKMTEIKDLEDKCCKDLEKATEAYNKKCEGIVAECEKKTGRSFSTF